MLSRLVLAAIVASVSAADVFSFANAVGDGMILAAAPKQAMVWGFLPPSSDAAAAAAAAAVTVGFGGASIAATVGPDQADGARTTWRALLPVFLWRALLPWPRWRQRLRLQRRERCARR